MMDADADGVIKVDHVLKVIELLGVENTELPSKQVKQIINVLCEEEKLKIEDNIEDILIKKPPKVSTSEMDEAFEKDLKALEDIAVKEPGKKDSNSSQRKQHRSRNGENP